MMEPRLDVERSSVWVDSQRQELDGSIHGLHGRERLKRHGINVAQGNRVSDFIASDERLFKCDGTLTIGTLAVCVLRAPSRDRDRESGHRRVPRPTDREPLVGLHPSPDRN